MRPYSWLMKLSRQSQKSLRLQIFFGIFSGFCIILQAYLLATMLDQFYLHNASIVTLKIPLIILLCVITLRALAHFFREKYAFITAATIKKNLRNTLFSTWINAKENTSQEKTGKLVSILIEHIEGLHGFFADYLPQMMITVILPIIILVCVFRENWLCGLLLLITAPLIPLFMALIGMHVATLKQKNLQLLAKLSAHFLDTLQGLSTLTLFHRAKAQTESIKTLSDEFRVKTMQLLRIAFLSSATLELFSTISIAMIAVYLGLGLLGLLHIGFSGVKIQLSQALFILLLAPEFFMPLRQLGHFYHAKQEAIAAAEEIMPLENNTELSTRPSDSSDCCLNANETNPTSNLTVDQTTESVDIEHIDFSYDHQKIFDNFSLKIPFGETVIITGKSGSGKSTLLYLLAKLRTPSNGKITINGIDAQSVSDDDWRSNIAFLHQYPRLQTGSIYENIAFANKTASRDIVFHAAEMAGVTTFSTDLSEMIYEQNAGLSGGQIQRIALARIILKDAPIVLFDEPTNYLDEKNIAIFYALINHWRHKKTMIIATHENLLIKNTKVIHL